EGLLVLPAQNQNEPYITVHPNFRVIFTSNPQEYAGVHEAQDALGDRIITIDMGYADRELEIAIAAARSGLPTASVTPISCRNSAAPASTTRRRPCAAAS